MDENVQNPNMQSPVVKKPNVYKALFFVLLFIVVVAGFAGGFYYLGRLQSQQPAPTSSPAPTQAQTFPPDEIEVPPTQAGAAVKDEDIVPVGKNTVSFARVGGNTYLRYRAKIYDDSNQFEPHEIQLPNLEQYTWHGLVDAPSNVVPNEFMNDEVFGFKVAPDKKSFAFVMRWNNEFYLFYYTPFDKLPQSILIKKFPSNDPTKIDQFSPDSKFLSLNLFDCWNCGGHTPETWLVRLKDNEMKNIARTSYFNWLTEGKYEYKDYVVITCTQESMGECSEPPENLPMKSGQF